MRREFCIKVIFCSNFVCIFTLECFEYTKDKLIHDRNKWTFLLLNLREKLKFVVSVLWQCK